MKYIRPVTIKKQCFIFMVLVASVLVLAGYVSAANVAGVAMAAKSKGTETQVQVPENMTPEEVDAFLAGISDEKTRQLLADKLKQEAAGNSFLFFKRTGRRCEMGYHRKPPVGRQGCRPSVADRGDWTWHHCRWHRR
jgi:hypothetical protein